MKKNFYIFILILAAVFCAGCSDEAAVQEQAPEMAAVVITTEEAPGDDYIIANVSAPGVDEQAEIKLRGNSTREVEKKAYTIKFEDELSFLDMEAGKKWALVSDPFDKSLLRPVIGFTFAQQLGLDYVSQTRLCKVWLNDVYMGVYTVMEPVEAGKGRVEIDPDDGDFLLERNMDRQEDDVVYMESSGGLRFEFNEPEEPDAAQQEQCFDMLQAVENAIFSGDHEQYEQLIDIESFVNFYIFHEVIKDVDFGEYSTRYYFKDGVFYAGPPWDLDLTMGNVAKERDEFKYGSYNNDGDSSCGMWASSSDYYYWLCRDPWFMEKVERRWSEVSKIAENLAEDNKHGTNLIDQYVGAYREELESNYTEAGYVGIDCWTVDEPAHMLEWQQPADTYTGNVELLREWLIKRVEYLDKEFGNKLF